MEQVAFVFLAEMVGRARVTPTRVRSCRADVPGAVRLLARVVRGVRIVSPLRVAEGGGKARLPRHLFALVTAHDAIGASARPGSIS